MARERPCAGFEAAIRDTDTSVAFFRAFLGRHAELFRTLPLWTLRLVFPHQIAHAYAGLQAVVRDELESPLHAHTVEELKWYFGLLRATPNARTRHPDERFLRAADAFGRPRFYRLYRQWLKEGDGALDGISSTLSSDALASGAGRIEYLVLPHRYDHLSPVVDTVGSSHAEHHVSDALRPDAVDVGGAME